MLGDVISREIGMNLWFAPQISEHWPKNNPGREANEKDWLRRPGTASILTPNEGSVHEWITSADEIKNFTCELKGITIRLSTSIKRKEFFLISLEGIMNESNSMLKSENS